VGHSNASDGGDGSFALQFAELLIEARRNQGLSCRAMAKRSAGRFSVAELHAVERGDLDLSDEQIDALSALYDADPTPIVPCRQHLHIGTGVLIVGDSGGSYTAGDTTSLLTTYLRLVRGVRRQQRAPYVELRREDVEHLAQYVERSGEWVVDQLVALMGVTRAQHRSLLGLFTAPMLIGLLAATLRTG
jgi:hypothetical protein